MCISLRTMFLLSCFLLIDISTAAPASKFTENPGNFSSELIPPKIDGDVEKSLEEFLNVYYDEYLRREEEVLGRANVKKPEDDIYETMQGDQPLTGNAINENLKPPMQNSSNRYLNPGYNSNVSYWEAARNRSRDNFIQFLKKNLLDHLGRSNMSMTKQDDTRLSSINISHIIPLLNSSNVLSDDQITEKIRSFYPSCEIPVNTDQDLWKDDDIMNLFFNFDNVNNDRNANIATATLRLYRLPDNATTPNTRSDDCDNPGEDEKLLRVSIYWYTKSLKKRRDFPVKRRLSDSKMIPVYSRWVELSVKPATKAWTKGRNLGMGVHVEDQEGNTLRADRYFKGASCMVGMSTPKPIPTIIIDAARKSNELHRIDSLLTGNSTSALYSDVHLLPTIDICTLEFPENYTQPAHIMNLRINACNLRKMHEQSQRLEAKEQLERLATLPEHLIPSSRHIRHQRQYLANKKNDNEGAGRDFDPRSRIIGSTVVMTNEEWQNYTNNRHNISTIDR